MTIDTRADWYCGVAKQGHHRPPKGTKVRVSRCIFCKAQIERAGKGAEWVAIPNGATK